jgi:hypothetical protein
MFEKLKELFFGKPTEKSIETTVPAPYKIEAPGTDWPFPKASEPTTENHVRVESVEPAADLTPVKKAPAKKRQSVKPATDAVVAPVKPKTPRKPRAK